MGRRTKPYRIIGAYDSETTNVNDKGEIYAFPILHQLGLFTCELQEIMPANVEECVSIELYRHALDLYARFDDIISSCPDFVPVICCHNLAFDMYGLSVYFDGKPNMRVLAKSCRKPITFTVCDDDGKPVLVFWDTLIFSQQPLSRMGEDCGYLKAVGEWDYDKIRTPETPLTDLEIDYATKDVYALIAWLGWWLRRNPDIEPGKLALNVVTKTGVVRERRKVRFDRIRGKGAKQNIGRFWHYLNKQQAPKDDDELYTMMAATRGGFTFCASAHASKVYDLIGTPMRVIGYDATSQHPAQMVSHKYPISFHRTSALALELAFKVIETKPVSEILQKWAKPFNSAFYGLFELKNIRPKANSLYAENGILPLASARFISHDYELNEDNQDAQEFGEQSEYKDSAVDPVFAFGKLVSAKSVSVYLTELAAWEVSQAYDYDDMHAIGGYISSRFVRPSDMAAISVMQFYKAKNEFKHARERYYSNEPIDNAADLLDLGIPEFIVNGMVSGDIDSNDIEATYLGLKADLNALFGIEASNEYRRNTVLTSSGIEYEGGFGICNAPKNPKAWYQFGQRIVGWSRIAQHCAMQLAYPYCNGIINGDTDSVKFLAKIDDAPKISEALDMLSDAIDKAKADVCERAQRLYPALFDDLAGIGHYIKEFEADRFCASWNKAYVLHDVDKRDGKRHFAFTLAGIPAKRGLNQLADRLYDEGASFEYICNRFLGYNATLSYDLIKLHARKFPEWGDIVYRQVTDYNGETSMVCEPAALALYPMAKTVNDTRNGENYENALIAIANNPDVNTDPIIITERRIYEMVE